MCPPICPSKPAPKERAFEWEIPEQKNLDNIDPFKNLFKVQTKT